MFSAVDLFSGCGGLTLGLRQAGFDVVSAIEIDEFAAATYSMNHPVDVWVNDIRQIDEFEFMEELELSEFELDLLAGCPPCQGFSSLQTRNGHYIVSDDRNDLIFDYFRFVAALRPKTLMMENVPGLESDYRFESLCNRIQKLGYSLDWKVCDAAKFGVPQRRKRLILIASMLGDIKISTAAKPHVTVRQAIGKLRPPGNTRDPIHDFPENRSQKIKKLIRRIPKDGGSRAELGKSDQLDCHRKFDGFKDVYGRMAWDDVSPTITSGCFNPSKGRFLHPEQNRTITMREAAILQSFPRNYLFPTYRGKTAIAEMIGNALPPKFVRYHAAKIKTHLFSHLKNQT